MNQSLAIIIAGAIVAFSVALSTRWQIAVAPVQNAPNPQVYRLDRWTGDVTSCNVKNPSASLYAGVILPCEPTKW